MMIIRGNKYRPECGKHRQSGLLLLLLMLLPLVHGCQQEREVDDSPERDGGKVELRFAPQILAFEPGDKLRSGEAEEPEVETLLLMVFEDHIQAGDRTTLLYISEATREVTGTFSAELYTRSQPCIIHAVANYEMDQATKNSLIGKDEREVVARLQGAGHYFWQRFTLGRIKAQSNIQSIGLLRSFAKVTLVNNSESTFTDASIKLYHSADRGTVAPFDPQSGQFAEGILTVAPDAAFSQAGDYATTHYPFETRNSDSNPLFVILKGNFNGSVNYYKIDLSQKKINAGGDEEITKLHLQRNYQYRIVLKGIKRPGAATEEEAAGGLAINSGVLDYALDAFPAIYSADGTRSLSVEQTVFHVGVHEAFITPRFSYKESGVVKNESVQIKVVEEDPTKPLIRQPINEDYKTSGVLNVTINAMEEGSATRQARIILEVTKDGERMVRSILIVQYASFSLEPVLINGFDPAIIDANLPAGQKAEISFVIPDDYPAHLYPIPVEIATSTLTPYGVTLPLKVVRREIDSHTSVNEIVYTYTADKPGTHTVPFKTNKKDTQEAVTVSAPNFLKAVTGYNMGRFKGQLTYSFGQQNNQVLPYRVPELISTSHGRISMIDATTEGQYDIYLPIPLLESTEPTDEMVRVTARLIYAESNNTQLTRLFTADVPVTAFRDLYQANKEDPAPKDIHLTHTSTMMQTRFIGLHHIDGQGVKETILIPKDAEVSAALEGREVPVRVWEDGMLEIDLPIVEHIEKKMLEMRLRIPTVTDNSGLIVEEYSDRIPVADVVNHQIEIKRTKVTMYGNIIREGLPLVRKIRCYFPPDYINPAKTYEVGTANRYEIELPADLSDKARIQFERGNVFWHPTRINTSLNELRKDATLVFTQV